ncbi:MAG TPA: lytic transglycosylase domain-containing protein [Hydrogenophilus thermoluteolus]|nr:lytic transglycosylase domain-containing protein [Hydrogenophilus thermoluteolus]
MLSFLFRRSLDAIRWVLAETVLDAALSARRKLTGRRPTDEDAPGAPRLGFQEEPHEVTIDGAPLRRTSAIVALRVFEGNVAGRISPMKTPLFAAAAKLPRTWNDYDAIISRAAARHQVPPAIIKAVAAVESSFNRKAIREEPQIADRSRGLMQMLERTARGLGFRGRLDDLYDPTVSLDLGAQLLAELFERYGNWTDALAAYNGGRPRKLSSGELVPILAQYVAKVRKRLGQLEGVNVAQYLGGAAPLEKAAPPAAVVKAGAAGGAVVALGLLALLTLGRRSSW